MTRKVWKIPRAGNISKISLEQESLAEIQQQEVRIATKAVGLNFADIFALVGLYSATPQGSFIPGLEFAGEIIEVGDEVTKFSKGDRVMGAIRFGGYASLITIHSDYCEKLPDDWSFEQGAAFPVQTLTAWYALKTLGDVQQHHNVLIQSAAGGVGLQSLKICRKLGINCFGTVGSEEKQSFLKDNGFSQIIVRKNSFKDDLTKLLAEQPLHLVLDAIGGKIQKQCYELLAPTGRLVVFGAAEYTPSKNKPNYLKLAYKYFRRPLYDPLQMVSENKSVMAFNLIWLWQNKELLLPLMQELVEMDIEAPYVGKKFPFEKAPDAIAWLRSGKSIGKVVLIVE